MLWDEASRKTSHDRIHFSDTELRDAQGAVLGVDADIDEVRFLWRSFTFACNDAVEYVAVQDEIYWAEFVIDREQKRLGINVTVKDSDGRMPLHHCLDLLPWEKL